MINPRATGVRITSSELIEVARSLVYPCSCDCEEGLEIVERWAMNKVLINESKIFFSAHDVRNFMTAFVSTFKLNPGKIVEIRSKLDQWLMSNRCDAEDSVTQR